MSIIKVLGKVFYISEAKQQTLKERIQQYFTKSNSGGIFKKNYTSQNNCDFLTYASFMKKNKIIFLTISQPILISALEAILYYILEPEYNINK
jgi:cytochrome c